MRSAEGALGAHQAPATQRHLHDHPIRLEAGPLTQTPFNHRSRENAVLTRMPSSLASR